MMRCCRLFLKSRRSPSDCFIKPINEGYISKFQRWSEVGCLDRDEDVDPCFEDRQHTANNLPGPPPHIAAEQLRHKFPGDVAAPGPRWWSKAAKRTLGTDPGAVPTCKSTPSGEGSDEISSGDSGISVSALNNAVGAQRGTLSHHNTALNDDSSLEGEDTYGDVLGRPDSAPPVRRTELSSGNRMTSIEYDEWYAAQFDIVRRRGEEGGESAVVGPAAAIDLLNQTSNQHAGINAEMYSAVVDSQAAQVDEMVEAAKYGSRGGQQPEEGGEHEADDGIGLDGEGASEGAPDEPQQQP